MGHPLSTLETLVAAHVDLVYAAALRQVRDPHLADDVTQAVFLVLVRKIDRLPPGAVAAWLLKVTRYTALTALRADRRRRHHEKAASVQTPVVQTVTEHDEQLAGLLDEALMALAQSDRELIVLRYMQGLSLGETASALRLRSNTAAKRAERALARMRRYFERRGVTTSTSALGAAIPAMMQIKAPATLAGGIVRMAASGKVVVPAIASSGPLGVLFMTISLQTKIAAALVLLAAAIAGTYAVTQMEKHSSPAGVAAVPLSTQVTATARSVDAAQSGVMHLKVMGEDGVAVPLVKVYVLEDYYNFPVVNPGKRYWRKDVTTREDGTISVTEPSPKPVDIAVRAAGFAPLLLRGVKPYEQDVYPITLLKGHTVKGVVKNDRDEPLAGVQMKLESTELAMEFLHDAVPTVITGKDGTFEFEHMGEGNYSLTAQMPDETAQWSVPPMDLTVAAGGDAEPLKIKAVAGITIRGEIVAPAEVDLSKEHIVVLTRLPKIGRVDLPINPDKTFVIRGISPESVGAIYFTDTTQYTPRLTWKEPVPEGFKLEYEYGRIDFSYPKAQAYEALKVEYLKFAKATGQVVDEQGKPVAKVNIEVGPTNFCYGTKANGRYTARIPPRMPIHLEPLDVKLAANQSDEAINLEPGEAIVRNFIVRRIVSRPHDQIISGQVVDRDGKAYGSDGMTVAAGNTAIAPDDMGLKKTTWTGGLFRPLHTTAATDGSFKFDQLYQGETDLWVIDPKAGFGAFMANVKAGTTDARLTLGPIQEHVRYTGQVVDSSGLPVPEVRVMMLLDEVIRSTDEYDKPALLAETRSDKQGRFSVEATPRWAATPELRLIFLPPKEAMAWKVLPRMSLDGLKIQLKPEGNLTGRVLDPKGEPLAGATVKLSFISDPAWGGLGMGRKEFEAANLAAITDAQGNYAMHGMAVGATATVFGSAPGYGQGAAAFTVTADGAKAEDIHLTDGITLEGTVRLGQTGQPVAGAKVIGREFETFATTTTDERGHYVMSGIDRASVSERYLTIRATAGEGDESLEGSETFRYALEAGDHIRGMDVTVDLSLPVRQAAWMAKPLANPLTSPAVLVLEDCDPAFSNQAAYHDTLSLVTPQGETLWQMSTLNVSETSTQLHKLAIDPKDHSAWICTESPTGLVHVKADGKLDWQKPKVEGCAVAIDPATSNAWVCNNKNVRVFDQAGNEVAAYPLTGDDIEYSTVDRCFWLVGRGLQKLNTSGQVISQSAVTFPYAARSLAINQVDGTVWVAEQLHPQVPGSQNRLLRFGRDGVVQKEIATSCIGLAVDGARKVVWLCGYSPVELTRISFDGQIQKRVPISAGYLAVEPSTGYVWAATRDGIYRVGLDGDYVWHRPSKGSWEKWMSILP